MTHRWVTWNIWISQQRCFLSCSFYLFQIILHASSECYFEITNKRLLSPEKRDLVAYRVNRCFGSFITNSRYMVAGLLERAAKSLELRDVERTSKLWYSIEAIFRFGSQNCHPEQLGLFVNTCKTKLLIHFCFKREREERVKDV